MSASLPVFRRRWPAIALIVSLVLNGFLVGMLAVDWLLPHSRGPSGERFAHFELRRFDDRLPREAVESISATLQPLAQSVGARFERLRAARGEVLRLAAEPQPDRAAIDARLAELRSESIAMQEEVQRATYDALLALPPEQRAGLAAAEDR